MDMLSEKEITDLRSKRQKTNRVDQAHQVLRNQTQAKKETLKRRLEAYKKVVQEEMQGLTVVLNLLKNEVERLRREKREGMNEVLKARAQALDLMRKADERIKKAESVEATVDKKMDQLEKKSKTFRQLLKDPYKLLS